MFDDDLIASVANEIDLHPALALCSLLIAIVGAILTAIYWS